MWKRKVMKKKARISMKQNYWRMISVCFLAAMLAGAYPSSTTFLGSQALIPSIERRVSAPFASEDTNSEVITEIVRRLFHGTFISDFMASPASFLADILVDLGSTSTSAFFSLLRAVNNFLTESWDISTFLLILGVIVSLLYHFFISNMLLVGERRYFLEAHSYRQAPISKIFFLYKLRCIAGPAWILFCRTVFQLLWGLTIVGGVIKYYEYRMIPFILAENPKISRRDAFFLSRQLMQHSKWKMFKMHVSFIGWKLLSLLTFGILDLVFVNPYMSASEAELYLTLRRNYVLSRSPRYEFLNDSYLEHVPSEDELLISKALYDDSRGPYTKISYFNPEQYPVFLFSVQPPFKAVRSPARAVRKYDFLSLVFLFHVFSILGWLAETAVHLLANGTLSDSFDPFLPWLPLYGIYGTIIILFIKKLSDRPVLVFLVNFLVYTVEEYAASLLIESALGLQPWDYSGYFLNLSGRVYVGGSVSVALFGCAFLYYIAPRCADHFLKLKKIWRFLLC
ncbi:MAG TPA: DUF975 family protein, partial [Candidatus Mediterraneibacter stercoravium]|nr:DUF975 family protein [Candidatus Mediterraneibacter stercoravium]